MDTAKLRKLLDDRDAIDAEIASTVNGDAPAKRERAPQKCSKCGEEGHSARTCVNKEKQPNSLAM